MRCMSLLMVYKASEIPVAPHSPEKPAKGAPLCLMRTAWQGGGGRGGQFAAAQSVL